MAQHSTVLEYRHASSQTRRWAIIKPKSGQSITTCVLGTSKHVTFFLGYVVLLLGHCLRRWPNIKSTWFNICVCWCAQVTRTELGCVPTCRTISHSVLTVSILQCKGRRQYLLTLQVIIYYPCRAVYKSPY